MNKTIIVLLIAILSFGLLFGCSGTPAVDNSSTTPSNNTGINSETNPGANQVVTGPSQNDSSVSTTFKSMLTGLPTYYVNYTLVSSEATGTLKQWIKNDKIKQESSFSEVSSTMYYVDNKMTVCTSADGEEMCFAQPNANLKSTGVDTAKDNADIWAAKVSLDTPRTVAGTLATCFKVTETDYTYKYCFSTDAVPLFTEIVNSQGTTTLTATEYSKTVDDSVFTVPAAQEFNIPGYS